MLTAAKKPRQRAGLRREREIANNLLSAFGMRVALLVIFLSKNLFLYFLGAWQPRASWFPAL